MADTKHPLYDAVKSWKEAHKIANLIRVKVKNIQKNIAGAVVEMDEVIELFKQLFAILPKTDGTLFGISPIAPNLLIEHLMDYVFRSENKEKNFSRRIKMTRILDFSKHTDFVTQVDLALGWAFKSEKSDLEKIV